MSTEAYVSANRKLYIENVLLFRVKIILAGTKQSACYMYNQKITSRNKLLTKVDFRETNFGETWTDNKSKVNITFDIAFLKLAINFLLDNCFLVFFNFDNLLLWQITGILMGSNPAPFMANLFLYYY